MVFMRPRQSQLTSKCRSKNHANYNSEVVTLADQQTKAATMNALTPNRRIKITLALALLLPLPRVVRAADSELDRWIASERKLAITKLEASITPPDGLDGAVIASPSKTDPDYYYHWVRD